MEEIWKDIEGYEGLYQISNKGNIKSFPKFHGNIFINKEKLLSLSLHKQGYVTVHLSNNFKKRCLVHRLVAKAFIPNPLNLPEVNHKDGDKINNNDWNLEWCTGKQNKEHAHNNNLTAKGERNRNNRFSEREILSMRRLYNAGWSQASISKMSGISQSTISDIVNNKTWKHI